MISKTKKTKNNNNNNNNNNTRDLTASREALATGANRQAVVNVSDSNR
jgi:hypothetical protein